MPTKVLIVDDSKVICTALKKELSKEFDLFVVDVAADPYDARDKILRLKPDVISLDVEMPKMDGLTFLRKLMANHPMPVVIFSSLAQPGSLVAIEALRSGAADVVLKPRTREEYRPVIQTLVKKIREAHRIHAERLKRQVELAQQEALNFPSVPSSQSVIALGASTGGASALEYILKQFPADAPATLIVQHMPQHFTKLFADRLNEHCRITVVEASDKEPVVAGRAYIAPGGQHMEVIRRRGRLLIELSEAPPVSFHRPSVDVLFSSLAKSCRGGCVAALLTGLGKDGAIGMRSLFEAGAHTIAQSRESAVCSGMPDSAVALQAVREVLDLVDIPSSILREVRKQGSAKQESEAA